MTTVREKHPALQRFRPSLILGIMTATAVSLSGVGAAFAESPYAIRDPKIAKNLSPAARARLQRAAAIKKIQEARKQMIETAKGKDTALENTQKGAANGKSK